MSENDTLTRIRKVKARYEATLLAKTNVVGVGIGLPLRGGEPVEEPGLIVNVTQKVPWDELDPEDRIPRMLDGVRVWVEVVGNIRAQSDR